MSTKKIREALRALRAATTGGILHKLADDALAEVEAIERAAKTWAETDGLLGPGRMKVLDELMCAIAKEAP